MGVSCGMHARDRTMYENLVGKPKRKITFGDQVVEGNKN